MAAYVLVVLLRALLSAEFPIAYCSIAFLLDPFVFRFSFPFTALSVDEVLMTNVDRTWE